MSFYRSVSNINDDDDDLGFSVPFNIIWVLSRPWKGDNESANHSGTSQ